MTVTSLKARTRKTRIKRRDYPIPPPDKIGLTFDEVCGISGLGMTSVRQLVADGQLPARQVGSRIVIRRDDVDQYLKSLPVKSAKK